KRIQESHIERCIMRDDRQVPDEPDKCWCNFLNDGSVPDIPVRNSCNPCNRRRNRPLRIDERVKCFLLFVPDVFDRSDLDDLITSCTEASRLKIKDNIIRYFRKARAV